MTPRALWLPYVVADLDQAVAYYVDHLGLTTVDGWDRDGERGAVLRAADAAYVLLVAFSTPPPGGGGPTLAAYQIADGSTVDALRARWRPAPPPARRFPRGHYGFEADGPGGARLLVWSEC